MNEQITKFCLSCKTEKVLDLFYFDSSVSRHKSKCKSCENKIRHTDEYRARIRKSNKTPTQLANHAKYRKTIKGRFTNFKAQAKSRGKILEITLQDYEILVNRDCHYCQLPLDNEGIGLDRLDNSLGYNINNVVPCCGLCNLVKGFCLTVEEMLLLGPKIKQIKLNRKDRGIEGVTLNYFKKTKKTEEK